MAPPHDGRSCWASFVVYQGDEFLRQWRRKPDGVLAIPPRRSHQVD
jgi:hypothetical protein